MNQSQRTLQEYRSTLSPADVLRQAKLFFQRRSALYAAFLEHEGPGLLDAEEVAALRRRVRRPSRCALGCPRCGIRSRSWCRPTSR